MTEAGRRKLDELRKDQIDPQQQLLLPWGGRSPRALTRAAKLFNLESQDDDANATAEDLRIEEQCRRHQYGS